LSLIVVEIGRDCDDSAGNGLSQVALCDFLHLSKDHSGDFFGAEGSVFALDIHGDGGLVVGVGDFEWEVLHIGLNILVAELPSDQTPECISANFLS